MALITNQVIQKPIEQRLIDAACIYWDVERGFFNISDSNDNENAHKRYILFYLIKTNTIFTYKSIGKMFGYKYHYSIQRGVEFVDAQKSVNRQVSGAITQITVIASNLDAEFITVDVRLINKKTGNGDIYQGTI